MVSLLKFTQTCFPGYRAAPHHILIAKTLERLASGEINRLMIFMPPRHGKSELVSVHFPAWFLGHNPNLRIIHASYSSSLSHRFSRAARNIVNSKVYQDFFPEIMPAKDSRSVEAWDIHNHRGGLISVGVGGSITGFGANLAIIDDPVKGAAEANSETIRESIKDWYRHDLRTRLEQDGKIIVCQTRWHQDDLSGWLLNCEKIGGEKWHVLHLPAISSSEEPLWKDKFSLDELRNIKRSIGTYAWEALYQGNPIPYGGALIKKSWFNIIKKENLPKLTRVVMGVDLAVSTKTSSDYTVAIPIGIGEDGKYYLLPPYRDRAEWPDARREIIGHAIRNNTECIGVEKVAFQAAAIQELKREPSLAGISIRNINANRDKITRVLEWSPIAESGRICIVDNGTGWHDVFLAECEAFPRGKHDDLIDSVSIAMSTLRMHSRDLHFK